MVSNRVKEEERSTEKITGRKINMPKIKQLKSIKRIHEPLH